MRNSTPSLGQAIRCLLVLLRCSQASLAPSSWRTLRPLHDLGSQALSLRPLTPSPPTRGLASFCVDAAARQARHSISLLRQLEPSSPSVRPPARAATAPFSARQNAHEPVLNARLFARRTYSALCLTHTPPHTPFLAAPILAGGRPVALHSTISVLPRA